LPRLSSSCPQQRASLLVDSIHGDLLRIADAGSAERIDVLIFPLKKSLQELSDLLPNISISGRERLRKQIATIENLTTGKDSISQIRKQELHILDNARELLKENVDISKTLTENVDILVTRAYAEIETANKRAKTIQVLNRNILIGVVAMSLVSSLLIVWLYVGRNLIARLTSLSSMMAIAGGGLC
jgi:adenylate cyclase